MLLLEAEAVLKLESFSWGISSLKDSGGEDREYRMKTEGAVSGRRQEEVPEEGWAVKQALPGRFMNRFGRGAERQLGRESRGYITGLHNFTWLCAFE